MQFGTSLQPRMLSSLTATTKDFGYWYELAFRGYVLQERHLVLLMVSLQAAVHLLSHNNIRQVLWRTGKR